MKPDGSDRKIIVTNCHLPDGIVVDAEAGHIYWTNMGIPNLNDGSIERADLDGMNRKIIVPQGITHTPKQIHLEKAAGKLYWCDREGMRVMRANLDGSQVETLVETGRGDKDQRDANRWCVGITIDPKLKKIYWTQKGPDNAGVGCIFRANINIPKGESPANRSDIELLFDKLPEPIDLELDLENRVLYWTDRGDPPRGNTVNRTPINKRRRRRSSSRISWRELASRSTFRATGCSSPTSPARSIPPISMGRMSATSFTPRAISLASPMPKSRPKSS
jgi:hypothetical protein